MKKVLFLLAVPFVFFGLVSSASAAPSIPPSKECRDLAYRLITSHVPEAKLAARGCLPARPALVQPKSKRCTLTAARMRPLVNRTSRKIASHVRNLGALQNSVVSWRKRKQNLLKLLPQRPRQRKQITERLAVVNHKIVYSTLAYVATYDSAALALGRDAASLHLVLLTVRARGCFSLSPKKNERPGPAEKVVYQNSLLFSLAVHQNNMKDGW